MASIELVQLDPLRERELTSDPAYRDAMRSEDWPRLAESVLRVVGRYRPSPSHPHELRWGSYLGVDAQTREVIGSCAFKGPPTDEGVVEIAYFTYPAFEGRGYATAMARELVGLVGGSTLVHRVIAHTLPHINASTRVLEKVGMTFAGSVVDPDDGLVWRWDLPLGS